MFVNLAAYRFARLESLPDLRLDLQGLCRALDLKGTILLSPEGINLFMAGRRSAVDELLARVRQIPGLADLNAKESLSEDQPFNRLLVKIKKEIIAFGVPGIEPGEYTSKRLSPQELKRWLDEGRSVTLLDTRNNFEIESGTFAGALPVGVDHFRDFPAAVKDLPAEIKNRPVVTFCTGGIRCEKAAPYLEREGFTEVYQLDGGILKYFEECGGEHYQGECFVFDKRVTLDPALQPGLTKQCFVCQATLTPEDQATSKYSEGVSCPSCWQPEEAALAERLAERQAAIQAASTPLPGSVPYDHVRPISTPLRLHGVELLDFLDAMHTRLTRAEWIQVCKEDRLTLNEKPLRPGRLMSAGERVMHLTPAATEPDTAADIELLHEDESLVVIAKPAPLPMHPCGRFNRNTLSYILGEAFAPLKLRIAHRLDADTTGVVLFTKNRKTSRMVQPLFERGEVAKTYLAHVIGRPDKNDFEYESRIADQPGPGGVRLPSPQGALSRTRFHVVERKADGTTLLEAIPITGRTNQIRIHLWEQGMPILGDSVYLPDAQIGATAPRSIGDPPLRLHALSIELVHPDTQERVVYTSPPPDWTEC